MAENLRFGCTMGVSDEQLWLALKKTRLAELFSHRKGLELYVQERGQNLSEGEKYRLGIVRAILAEKPFAALDHVSIKAIVDLIKMESRTRGVVVVTHYLPLELRFDSILDFESLKKGWAI